jgi:branched-chain amino acid transport system permease protein
VISKLAPKVFGELSSSNSILIIGGAAFLALAFLPAIKPSNYLLHIAVLIFVYVALGIGLNIVVGLAGLLDLGYVAFYAVGAYSYALLSTYYQFPSIALFLIGGCMAAVIGVLLGWPTIRTRGDYLALVTLAFGEMIRLLLRNWDAVTNGPRGIMDVPPPRIASFTFSTPTDYYYLGLGLGVMSLLLFWRVKHSAVGLQLAAIRDDEDAATAIGINPVRWKLYAFALGAFVAGLAGVFFASWQRFVSPESFTLGESILILSIVVLGGTGRMWPTIGAAAFLVLLPEVLREFETARVLVLGMVLLLTVILQERVRLLSLRRRAFEYSSSTPLPSRLATLDFDDIFNSVKTNEREIALRLSGLSKSFGGVRALEDINLEIYRGEILGLVGANGAGKTTLFNCISGAVTPDKGEIYIYADGQQLSITNMPAYKVARKGLIRTFQQPRLFASLTSLENAILGLRCRQVPALWEALFPAGSEQASTKVAARLLSTVGAPRPSTVAIGMSFVDQKLTELARSLATVSPTGHTVLLVDEPASGMEPAARAQLAEVLRKANEQLGITLLVVEHDLEFLGSICDRFVVLDRGRVVVDGSPDDLRVIDTIRRIYNVVGRHEGAA